MRLEMERVGRTSNATLRKRKSLIHTWHHTGNVPFSFHNSPGGRYCYYSHFTDEKIEAQGHIGGGQCSQSDLA